jgi:hypothetical protein
MRGSMRNPALPALPQQWCLAATSKRYAIFDPYRPVFRPVEYCPSRIFAHQKYELLPLLNFGARLKDHLDGNAARGKPFGGKDAVAIHGKIRAEIVVLEDQAGAGHRYAHVGICGCRRLVTIGCPFSEQTELLEYLFDRCGIHACGDENDGRNHRNCKQAHFTATPPFFLTIAAVCASAIDLSQDTQRFGGFMDVALMTT